MGICLSQHSFLFLADFLTFYHYFGKASAIVTKYSVLDVVGVLNHQYARPWIAYSNNLIQVSDKDKNWSL